MTTIMFAGMSLCLPLALAKDKVARSGRAAAAAAEKKKKKKKKLRG
jgi:hypothetical protein